MKLRKIVSLLLLMVMCVSFVPNFSTDVQAASYNVYAALAYAKEHWDDNDGSMCAEFVSRCVKAGGLGTPVITTVTSLRPALEKASGLDFIDLKVDSKGYVTKALNGDNVQPGDVVIQYCFDHNIAPHVVLFSGYNSSGQACYYAHTAALGNEPTSFFPDKDYSYKKHTPACHMGPKVIRLSTLDPLNGLPMPGMPSTPTPTPTPTPQTLASFKEATDADYVAKKALTEDNATVVNQVNKQSGVKVTQVGLYLYDANGNLIKKHTENISNVSNSQTKFHCWYDIKKELGITLSSGTTYKYKFFGIFNGKEIAGNMGSFTTKGPTPAPTPAPAPTPTPTPTPTPEPTPESDVPKRMVIQIAVNLDGTDKWNAGINVGEPLGDFPAPVVPEGYKFKGFYTEKTGGKKVDENTIFTGETTVYYAQFEKIEEEKVEEEKPEYVTVYFDANGGKCSPKKLKVTIGERIDDIPIPTRSGYTFKGWYADESLGNKKLGINTIINTDKDFTVYAEWEKDDSEESYCFPFDDVKSSDWYFNDIKNSHKMGLINGKSAKKYSPDDYMTYAEAIKIAACMHQMYHEGEVTLTNSPGVWYESYIEYAIENGIPWHFSDYDAKITREKYVYIFYHALPDECYREINNIKNIPDMDEDDYYADAVYTFYRAGILTGVDSKGRFSPNSNIIRGEVATIISRMMDKTVRKEFSLGR